MRLISEISIKRRLFAIIMLITFLFFIVFGKLFYLQIILGSDLQAKALDQWTRDVPLTATRGDICDCNGVILAGTNTTYTLFVRPNSTTSVEASATAIANALNLNYQTVFDKINRKGVSEIRVARKVTKDQMQKIKSSGVDGVYFSQDIERYYTYGNYLSQVLGFTNIDGDGQSGLEAYYNKYLCGVDGYQLTETDLIGKALNDNISYISAISGMTLNLTVDSYIQYFAESAVNAAYTGYSAKSASCIVMNAKTGAILAMAQSPSFDLNNIDRSNVTSLFDLMKLNSISSVYEPGSTFKILTAAIALNENLVSDTEKFYCSGSKLVDGQRIKCWKSQGHGSQTFAEGVRNSCNCVFMELAERIGVNTMYSYFDSFGLKSKTGIDITGETSGLLLAKDSVKTVDLARIGFGQAIAITPLELIVAAATAINGGNKVTPYLVDSIYDSGGNLVSRTYPKITNGVISSETSAKLRGLLEGVVTLGSGKLGGVAGYSIGGKTGTAQKYENGTIARGKYVSSFIGFSSVENPEYIIYFMVDEPQGYLYYGSLVAAPYVGEIFERIFAYKEMAPTETVAQLTYFEMPDLTGLTAGTAIKTLKKMGVTYEISGSGGKVVNQFPVAGTICSENNVLYIGLSED